MRGVVTLEGALRYAQCGGPNGTRLRSFSASEASALGRTRIVANRGGEPTLVCSRRDSASSFDSSGEN